MSRGDHGWLPAVHRRNLALLFRALMSVALTAGGVAACEKTSPPEGKTQADPTVATPSALVSVTLPESSQRPPDPAREDALLSEAGFSASLSSTDVVSKKLRGRTIEVGGASAYLSLPARMLPGRPALLVMHGRVGLSKATKRWSDRLAAAGYGALAIDRYGGKMASDLGNARLLAAKVDPREVVKVQRAAMAYLRNDPLIRAERIGTIGYDHGTRFALELALVAPEVAATVLFYGPTERDAARLATLQAPLLGIFAKRDPLITPRLVDRFEHGLEQATDKRYRILRYDASHGFSDPSDDNYDPVAAAAAWSETRAFLKEHLAQP